MHFRTHFENASLFKACEERWLDTQLAAKQLAAGPGRLRGVLDARGLVQVADQVGDEHHEDGEVVVRANEPGLQIGVRVELKLRLSFNFRTFTVPWTFELTACLKNQQKMQQFLMKKLILEIDSKKVQRSA